MKRPTHSDKRNQIIASTIKLLRKTGFEKVSVRAICQNADISIGTFYHYFRDKDDLLRAVLGGIDEYLLDEIQPQLTHDSQLANLRAFALSFADSTVST
ncbi:MAG: TetR/AcrR family transcriptional regulator, partial [Candidatus Spyradocola sp.]